MNSLKKGDYGYLIQHRRRKLFATLTFALMIIFIVVTMLIMFGDTKRVAIVFAILLALPLAKYLIAFILCAGFLPLNKNDYAYIKKKTGDDFNELLFDMTITKYEGARFYPVMLIKNGKIYAFVYESRLSKGKADYQTWIKDAVSQSKYEYKIFITSDIDEFIKKVLSVSQPNHNNRLIDKHIRELIMEKGI
mgnify:CR=1 FL=1